MTTKLHRDFPWEAYRVVKVKKPIRRPWEAIPKDEAEELTMQVNKIKTQVEKPKVEEVLLQGNITNPNSIYIKG